MTEAPVDVAAAVIRRGDRYLVCKRRAGDRSGGLWEFPGGKREPGETLEGCLEREIREELDCAVRPGRLILRTVVDRGDRTLALHFYECAIVEGEPRPIECDELAWARPDEFAMYDFLPPNVEVLSRLA